MQNVILILKIKVVEIWATDYKMNKSQIKRQNIWEYRQ